MPKQPSFILQDGYKHKITGIRQRETEGEPHNDNLISFNLNKLGIFF